jgi:hypothetical protein
MNSGIYRARRATTDDLSALVPLWESAHLPAAELDKRFTEFQVVENDDGKLLGAIGLQISGKEGKIHSEAYTDFALTDILRPILWQRINTVASNHGLFRLWTDEPAPFWKKECGFALPSAEARSRSQFGDTDATLLALQLREDAADPDALDAEFARFKAEEKLRTDKMFQQARVFKWIAWGLAAALFVFVVIGLVHLVRYRSTLQH